MADNYIYADARIRCLELSLFSKSTIEQLLAEKEYEGCLQFLRDRGWGNSENTDEDADQMLSSEEEKTWKTVGEMVHDMKPFDVLRIPDMYQNLKAAVKSSVVGKPAADVFVSGTAMSGEEMTELIQSGNFNELPGKMPAVAKEAYESFIHTGDGQLCDVIVDHGALEAVLEAAAQQKEPLIKQYAETTVAVADIKIAVRSAKTGKSRDFMERAMVPCSTVSVEKLIRAAAAGTEEVISYLKETDYKVAAEALGESSASFERWCDDSVIETIKPQKYNSFTIGAVVAYVLARMNEIKTVRIVLSGKLNGMPEDSIRERVREMYV